MVCVSSDFLRVGGAGDWVREVWVWRVGILNERRIPVPLLVLLEAGCHDVGVELFTGR